MISVNLSEKQDIIEPNDWVRQLDLVYEGQSDYLQTTATYSGMPINRLRWQLAKYYCPAWVGKTVGELNKKVGACEFARGTLPDSHIVKLTVEQKKVARILWPDG